MPGGFISGHRRPVMEAGTVSRGQRHTVACRPTKIFFDQIYGYEYLPQIAAVKIVSIITAIPPFQRPDPNRVRSSKACQELSIAQEQTDPGPTGGKWYPNRLACRGASHCPACDSARSSLATLIGKKSTISIAQLF